MKQNKQIKKIIGTMKNEELEEHYENITYWKDFYDDHQCLIEYILLNNYLRKFFNTTDATFVQEELTVELFKRKVLK
jgi:hypothetical protein